MTDFSSLTDQPRALKFRMLHQQHQHSALFQWQLSHLLQLKRLTMAQVCIHLFHYLPIWVELRILIRPRLSLRKMERWYQKLNLLFKHKQPAKP